MEIQGFVLNGGGVRASARRPRDCILNARECPGEHWTGQPPALSHLGCCLRGGPGQVPLPLFLRAPFEAQGGLRPPLLGGLEISLRSRLSPALRGGGSVAVDRWRASREQTLWALPSGHRGELDIGQAGSGVRAEWQFCLGCQYPWPGTRWPREAPSQAVHRRHPMPLP